MLSHHENLHTPSALEQLRCEKDLWMQKKNSFFIIIFAILFDFTVHGRE